MLGERVARLPAPPGHPEPPVAHRLAACGWFQGAHGHPEKWCAGWRGGGHGAGLQRGELSSVPSPGQLHVRARGDAHTGPVPSPGWETMCSQPHGAAGGPPSRNDHDLLLRGVNELCRTTMGTGRLQ